VVYERSRRVSRVTSTTALHTRGTCTVGLRGRPESPPKRRERTPVYRPPRPEPHIIHGRLQRLLDGIRVRSVGIVLGLVLDTNVQPGDASTGCTNPLWDR
jgi:hypothetical protein